MNIALPHIQNALEFSTTELTWVVSAYTLTFGGMLLLGGRAGDILGRRRVFMTGILLFTFASLLGGLAQEPWQLLAARVLQGVGGAIASPTSLALITTTFPEGPNAIAPSASSPRSPRAAAPSACSRAACSPSGSTGGGCSSSMCRSAC
ncbi:hypothetical protein SHKM778_23150 [Streptomyces sp. KM77-8]|uniref:Major facilitator superfamily (MFS) profile domain-containing protein n=1 Tax=Streptomyces haneummycinicus TaxID=3074435 RepID=A0AAT9HEY4_9ACTN